MVYTYAFEIVLWVKDGKETRLGVINTQMIWNDKSYKQYVWHLKLFMSHSHNSQKT